MKKRSHIVQDILIIGFALFSMFFGAGNIIFPTYLGMQAANTWMTGFGAYFLADVGLSVFAIFAMLKINGNMEDITGKLGRIPGILLTSTIIICIGVLLANPRAGAATYEMFTKIVFGENRIVLLLTSIVYFGIILLLTFHESSVVDIIGKYLTPILLLGLLVLIIKGVLTPIGPIAEQPLIGGVVAEGIVAGYQTMDILAALAYGAIIIKTTVQKGYHNNSEKSKVIGASSLVAAGMLFIVFYGLAYLGATTSTLYDIRISRADLTIRIMEHLLGNGGVILLGIVVSLACMTTSAALTSTTAEYFSRLSKGRFSYKTLVVCVCLICCVITNFGLESIIRIASPILSVVYPATLVLITLTFFSKHIRNNYVYQFSAVGAMLFSLLDLLSRVDGTLLLVPLLPLAEYGFGWVLPAILFGLLGHLFSPLVTK